MRRYFITTLNWFRLKKLSYIAQNRLILERAQKHLNLFNNATLLFKNAKWLQTPGSNINFISFKILKNFFKITFIWLIIGTVVYTLSTLFGFIPTYFNLGVAGILAQISSFITRWILKLVCPTTDNKIIKQFDTFNGKSSSSVLYEKHSLVNEIESEDNTNATSQRGELQLLKQAYLVSLYMQKLNDQQRIVSLKRLIRGDLDWIDAFPITSENAKLGSLKLWTNAMMYNNTNPYMFDQKKTEQMLTVNPSWTLDTICADLNVSKDILELINSPENVRLRKLNTQNNNVIFLWSFDNFQKTTKLWKWLSKNTFLNNQNMINSNLTTNTKKLFTMNGDTANILKSNMWVANNVFNALDNNELLKNFTNSIDSLYKTSFNINQVNDEKQILQNKLYSTTNTDETLARYYEDSFFWLLKRINSLDNFENRSAKINLKLAATKNVTESDLANFFFLHHKLNNVFMTFQDSTISVANTNSNIADIFYNTSRNSLFGIDNAALVYELSSNKSDDRGVSYYYSLDKYSTLLPSCDDVDVANITTDINDLKPFLKSQMDMSLAPVDLINKEYTKDLYRYIHLVTNNKNN